jgi:hypothetical protein
MEDIDMADVRLTQLFTNIANAIRNKKGSDGIIKAVDFPAEIESIEVGGGEVVEVEEKDVNFYDYDGTLLFSYTLAEAQALTELPTPKGHEGLIFQGWNWDYEDVIALDYPMDIGAMYITDDGKTRLYLEVEDEEGVDIEFGFTQTANDVIVDFGDGSPTQTSADATAIIPHHYAKGSYVLKMWSQGNKNYVLKTSEDRNCFSLLSRDAGRILRKIELGESCSISTNAFQRCRNLETLAVPLNRDIVWTQTFQLCLKLKHINFASNSLQVNCFAFCRSLQHITLPKKNITISSGALQRTGLKSFRVNDLIKISSGPEFSAIEELYIPKGLTSLPTGIARGCWDLKKVVIDSDITTMPNAGFNECFVLQSINIPQSVTKIDANAFGYTKSLQQLVFPPNLTTIAGSAFFYSGCFKFDFSACLQIPSLANTAAFNNTPATSKIIVSDALYDAWKAATNWSTYADRIVKASEYNG